MLSLTSPVNTPFHAIRAAPKLVILCVTTIALFQVNTPVPLALAATCIAALYVVGGTRFAKAGLGRLKPLWVFAAVILIWHSITVAAIDGVVILLRLLAVVGLANLVTMTTRLDELTETAIKALEPFRRLGVNPARVGFSVGLVLRFIPVLLAKADSLMEAWKAKSARRPNWRILLPIFLTTLDDAEHVAEALRARGGLSGIK